MGKPMLNKNQFVHEVFRIAEERGFRIENNRRNDLKQIDFGLKKLHAGHLEQLYPTILSPTEKISDLIEKVAPGRPCSHKPMREIIREIRRRGK